MRLLRCLARCRCRVLVRTRRFQRGYHEEMMLGRDRELTALRAAAAAATAGCGAVVLLDGPAGIGKTTLLRAACGEPHPAGLRILTASGLAIERGFPYGIVRQLIEPVRAAAGPGKWDALLDGAAGLRRACSTGPKPAPSKTTSGMRGHTAFSGWSRSSRPPVR
jgi:energy-coupling factor transporter ATP-binding protein EcfA2